MAKKALTYQSAGVDTDLYDKSLQGIFPLLERTRGGRCMGSLDGYASLFDLTSSKKFTKNYKKPVLVTCTDGVGTKLKIASMMKKFDTVGIDLVAMSVNDCLCTGGLPVMFLDYLALPKDNPELIRQLVEGITAGCEQADCSLVGGETAILPDFYADGDYDMAGFCVGVVEKDHIIEGEAVEPGDQIIGLASSGLHSNGYSLARKIVFDHAKLKITSKVAELGRTVGEELLEPTRIYVPAIKALLDEFPGKKKIIRGLAHITGEGMPGNIPRVLPPNCRAFLKRGSWPIPPVFTWLQNLGDVAQDEMDKVFNQGIGFVMIVKRKAHDKVMKRLEKLNVPAYPIGEVRHGQPEVEWE
jgi:phosphoribosylformylglycinamidine cyclo-ligase